jgi:Flp pilus assembly pilin Flp
MKSFIARFVRDPSGAVDLADGLIALATIAGIIAALALIYYTIFQLLLIIAEVLPAH